MLAGFAGRQGAETPLYFTYSKFSQRRYRVEGPCMATEGFFNGLLARIIHEGPS